MFLWRIFRSEYFVIFLFPPLLNFLCFLTLEIFTGTGWLETAMHRAVAEGRSSQELVWEPDCEDCVSSFALEQDMGPAGGWKCF